MHHYRCHLAWGEQGGVLGNSLHPLELCQPSTYLADGLDHNVLKFIHLIAPSQSCSGLIARVNHKRIIAD
jgi:hypothetical protein